MSSLVLCHGCNRHARGARCPFCGNGLASTKVAATTKRLGRAALLVALTGCHESVVQPYGAPVIPDDAGSATTATLDAGDQ
jgi:hypothetical protein